MVNNTTEENMGVSATGKPATSTTVSEHHTSTVAILVTDPVDDVERTTIGIPVSLLWVPYVIFTLVIISLMIASFCKFHRKHGHKYKRRRMELFQQINMNQLLNQLQVGGTTNLPPNGGAPNATTQIPTTSDKHTNSTNANTKKKPKARRKQRPLTFMRNANGSMVDLRCGERASMNIFKTPFSTHSESSIWTLPTRGGAYRTLNPHGGNYFSDEDDDEILLIHSTKL